MNRRRAWKPPTPSVPLRAPPRPSAGSARWWRGAMRSAAGLALRGLLYTALGAAALWWGVLSEAPDGHPLRQALETIAAGAPEAAPGPAPDPAREAAPSGGGNGGGVGGQER